MKKKILIHAPNLSTPGGKQTYYTAVRGYFKSDVSFFFYGAQGKKETKWQTIRRMYSDYAKFYRALKKEKYDLVLLNPSLNPKSFFRDSLFALVCTMAATKMVVFWRGWNWDFERKVVKKILPFFNFTYGKADAMIILAKEFWEQLRAYGYNKQLYLETTTVDDAILNFVRRAEPEHNGQVQEDEIAILFLARVERNKGVFEAIDSFQRLRKKYSNIVLNIAGTGGALEEAKQYVADQGIEKVNFTGWIAGKEKAELLHRSHIYVLASYHGEGMPNSLLEAMASGLSVVTTDVGGIKDFFEPERMGYYVRPKDTDDLEQKLDQLLANPEHMEYIRKYNAAYAREHFAPVHVARRLENIYEAMAS